MYTWIPHPKTCKHFSKSCSLKWRSVILHFGQRIGYLSQNVWNLHHLPFQLSGYGDCISNKLWGKRVFIKWTASSEFGTYRLCEQRRFRRACASAQSRQKLRCSLIQAVIQEEPSDRKPNPWFLWMAGHAQLKFIMTECSKTQICLTGLKYNIEASTWTSFILVYTEKYHSSLALYHYMAMF